MYIKKSELDIRRKKLKEWYERVDRVLAGIDVVPPKGYKHDFPICSIDTINLDCELAGLSALVKYIKAVKSETFKSLEKIGIRPDNEK
ncbi:MAG: hypothetical protein LBL33_10775 [Tannerella sp.]|jgi:hypothetical protein|nr:hypothetical protein [Tannerella sp.]